jgi:hypothetical protein
MSPAITIYSQTYAHKGHAFTAWSYLDGKNVESSSMRFAVSVEGETVAGLLDRAEAIRKARQRIDELPAKPIEDTPVAGPPQAIRGHPPQQAELALG